MVSRVVQARVPGEIQDQANAIIKAMGLTVSDVVRVLMTRIATDKVVPLDLFQPNEETLQAMRDAQEGRMERTSIEGIRSMIREARAQTPKAAKR